MVGLGKGFADAPEYVGCNDLGTAVLLAAMAEAGVRGLVLAGSMVVYGEGRYDVRAARPGAARAAGRRRPGRRAASSRAAPSAGHELAPGLVGEDAPVDPRNVYATTKLAQEHLAAAWARATGGTAVALRYHNVYGPGMPRDTPYAGVAAFFRSALARGEAPAGLRGRRPAAGLRARTGRGRGQRAALEAAADARRRADARTTSAAATRTPSGEMARRAGRRDGGPAPVVTGEFRLGDVRHITADSARLRAELGWKPEVGFAEGMREFATAAGLRGAGGSGR